MLHVGAGSAVTCEIERLIRLTGTPMLFEKMECIKVVKANVFDVKRLNGAMTEIVIVR